jgi:hypothetical protein
MESMQPCGVLHSHYQSREPNVEEMNWRRLTPANPMLILYIFSGPIMPGRCSRWFRAQTQQHQGYYKMIWWKMCPRRENTKLETIGRWCHEPPTRMLFTGI